MEKSLRNLLIKFGISIAFILGTCLSANGSSGILAVIMFAVGWAGFHLYDKLNDIDNRID